MTVSHLIILLSSHVIGVLSRSADHRLNLVYDQSWADSPTAFPLSLSMPLTHQSHPHEVIEAFLWGLLPDNDLILNKWARRFQVSARSPFALIAAVGEDCPGAVQFVRPNRLAAVQTADPSEIDWLDEPAIGARLRILRADPSAWQAPGERGQFSLAGAQPKTALLRIDGRWGIPSGRMPTTHILKPPTGEFDGHAENEHFCLVLARTLGLPAASSEVRRFDGEVAVVIERYDRIETQRLADAAAAEAASWLAAAAGADSPKKAAEAARLAASASERSTLMAAMATSFPILRLHQEDLCQAFGLPPTQKYQNEGGPGAVEISRLLSAHSSRTGDDLDTFLDALAFNWLIAGTDAHAKNYALLHGGSGRIRLAPLYDLASALPYPQFAIRRLKLAMKIGGEARLDWIGGRHWRRLATELDRRPDEIIDRVVALARRLPEAAEATHDLARTAGLDHPILARLRDTLTARARRCRDQLSGTGLSG